MKICNLIIIILFALSTGCAVTPTGRGSKPKDWGDASEPSGPTGFMDYSEQRAAETIEFNPCRGTGVKWDTRKFSAGTTTEGESYKGVTVKMNTDTRKSGECNGIGSK